MYIHSLDFEKGKAKNDIREKHKHKISCTQKYCPRKYTHTHGIQNHTHTSTNPKTHTHTGIQKHTHTHRNPKRHVNTRKWTKIQKDKNILLENLQNGKKKTF